MRRVYRGTGSALAVGIRRGRLFNSLLIDLGLSMILRLAQGAIGYGGHAIEPGPWPWGPSVPCLIGTVDRMDLDLGPVNGMTFFGLI